MPDASCQNSPAPKSALECPKLPPLFDFGRVLATPAAIELLKEARVDVSGLLARHQSGDWGDLSADDKQANTEALVSGERLLSAYKLPDNHKVWIITEADRSATTLLLPEEY